MTLPHVFVDFFFFNDRSWVFLKLFLSCELHDCKGDGYGCGWTTEYLHPGRVLINEMPSNYKILHVFPKNI